MASLTLHDIPEELLEQLESRAQANSRSLEAEVLLVLESIVVPKATSPFGAAEMFGCKFQYFHVCSRLGSAAQQQAKHPACCAYVGVVGRGREWGWVGG